MCGRFTIFADDAQLISLFDIDITEGEHKASYNQAPTQMVRVVRQRAAESPLSAEDLEVRVLDLMKWGLVPFWAKKDFRALINARAETLTTKPAFRAAAAGRRLLIPTNGYYEWQGEGSGAKQPFFLSLADRKGNAAPPGDEPILAMAGIFETPNKEGPEEVATCAIITRSAPDSLGHIHDRMPVFVPRSLWSRWLDPQFTNPSEIQALLDGIPPAPLAPRAVGRAVGSVRNNDPSLIYPAPDLLEGT